MAAHRTAARQAARGAAATTRARPGTRGARRRAITWDRRRALALVLRGSDVLLDLLLPDPGLHVRLDVHEREIRLVVAHRLAALGIVDLVDLADQHVVGAGLHP